ncbi:MAG TPA: glycosyltransferase family A protein [Gammaproteobacteria bacterium]|nr:glycosyltransferase family A protein [Gammaproteobacteria bacterium]
MYLTVVVVFYQMAREAPRTLYSLSRDFQRDLDGVEYEVLALDHGSDPALDASLVKGFGRNFSCVRVNSAPRSPVQAVNEAVRAARGKFVAINIDGARILSPGLLSGVVSATRLYPSAFVHTLGFHLGPGLQNETMTKGYDQQAEDALLAGSNWEADGYRLFDVSVLAASSSGGFFSDISESNCFALPRSEFLNMGGLHPGFQSPGGGISNLDFFNRALQNPSLVPVRLLGEGTFHQFHGGVAANAPAEVHPWSRFRAEYESIYKHPWTMIKDQDPVFFGRIHQAARQFI